MTTGTCHIAWQGGEHDFCLSATGDILALEETCKAGVAVIYTRLAAGTWYLNDIRETIRLGLIGGGMSPADALKAVKTFVESNPRGLGPSVMLALEILGAVIIGVPDDPVGKPAAADATTDPVSTETTVASAAQPSSESALH